MKFRFLPFYIGIIFLLFILPVNSKALAASGSSILVNIAPENPSPYENTTITISSYANNLDSVLISWSVDGKTVLSGIGKKVLSVKAGAAGSEMRVKAVINLPEGSLEKNMVIRPAVMVLLWQANDSYVPPFYKGKALPTAESEVKVVAMPEIKNGASMVNAKNMTYSWQQDYTNNVDGSGYGKNYFTFTNDYLDDSNNINVTASTIDQKYSSNASIDIGMTTPKILFYKNTSNLGTLWDNTLQNNHKIQDTEVLDAVPYFIAPKEIQNPRLVWTWSINDAPVNVLSFRQNLMPLKVTPGLSGTSTVKLQIRNMDKIFQSANNEMNIQF